jgi:hypothetical protein
MAHGRVGTLAETVDRGDIAMTRSAQSWLPIVACAAVAACSDDSALTPEEPFGPQMYGELFAHRLSDGLEVRLTRNKWEEGESVLAAREQGGTGPCVPPRT